KIIVGSVVLCIGAIAYFVIGQMSWMQKWTLDISPPAGWSVVGKPTFVYTLGSGRHEVRVLECDHVGQFFMHEPDRYTVYIVRTNTPELSVQTYAVAPKIFIDVPPGKPIWMRIKETAGYPTVYSDWEIHIHSDRVTTEIAGAGWQRAIGKSQIETGTTIPLEQGRKDQK